MGNVSRALVGSLFQARARRDPESNFLEDFPRRTCRAEKTQPHVVVVVVAHSRVDGTSTCRELAAVEATAT